MNSPQDNNVIKESTSNEQLNGYTFPEWCEYVSNDFKIHGYIECSQDKGFVEHIAVFCWGSVQDGEADDLESSLDGCYYEMKDEFFMYQKQHTTTDCSEIQYYKFLYHFIKKGIGNEIIVTIKDTWQDNTLSPL